MKLTSALLFAAVVLHLALLSGCGKQTTLLEPDPRASREVERYGKGEALARAQERANRLKTADAYMQLAHTQALAGQPKEAREVLEKALARDPKFPAAAVMKAQLLLTDGKPAEAVKVISALTSQRPDLAEAVEIHARALMHQGKLDEALKVLEPALKRHGNVAVLWWAQGDILAAKKQYEEAKQSYRRVLKLEKKSADARLVYAQLLLAAGDKEQAAKHAREAVQLGADDARVRFIAGTHLYEAGQTDEAITQYKESLVLNPNNPAAANNLALILADTQQETATAVAWARKAVAAAPKSLAVADTLGWALARDGQYDDALKVLREVRRYWPKNGAVAYHLGWTLAKSGQRAAGVKLLQEAIASGRADITPLAQKALSEFSR